MEVTHDRVDLPRYWEQMQSPRPGVIDDLPQVVIPRRPGDVWLVSHAAIEMEKPIQWQNHRKDDHVMIPLFPYLVRPEPDLAMAHTFQLGIRCSFDLGRPVRRLHLAMGSPVNQISSDDLGELWQYYLGFAVVLD